MNNFLIFRSSFFHLFDGTSLYELYPSEHNDLFKYSPTFAVLMAPFATLPPVMGAVLWNLSGAMLLIAGILRLPVAVRTQKTLFWVSLPEFIGSTQGFQSNIHVVGLLLLFFSAIENRQAVRGALFILLTFFIKIFGILGLILFVFSKYSYKDLKFFLRFCLASAGLGLLLLALPGLLTSWENGVYQHMEWMTLLKNDSTLTYGFSFMGVLHSILGFHFKNFPVQFVAGLTWFGVLLWSRDGDLKTRLWGLISLLYFLVVFNHKAESPTFIIVMVGFGIHLSLIENKKLWWTLLIVTLGFVSLVYSDLFPRDFKQLVADKYCFKILPFLLLYPLCLYRILQPTRKGFEMSPPKERR